MTRTAHLQQELEHGQCLSTGCVCEFRQGCVAQQTPHCWPQHWQTLLHNQMLVPTEHLRCLDSACVEVHGAGASSSAGGLRGSLDDRLHSTYPAAHNVLGASDNAAAWRLRAELMKDCSPGVGVGNHGGLLFSCSRHMSPCVALHSCGERWPVRLDARCLQLFPLCGAHAVLVPQFAQEVTSRLWREHKPRHESRAPLRCHAAVSLTRKPRALQAHVAQQARNGEAVCHNCAGWLCTSAPERCGPVDAPQVHEIHGGLAEVGVHGLQRRQHFFRVAGAMPSFTSNDPACVEVSAIEDAVDGRVQQAMMEEKLEVAEGRRL